MPDRITVALVNGGTRDDRFCDTAAMWIGGRIWEQRGFTLDLIAPDSLPGIAAWPGDNDETVQALRRRLARAHAGVIVVPARDTAMPAALQRMIECTGTQWREKPVGFVACGDLPSGEPAAIERVRFAFEQLHASILADIVRLDRGRTRFDADGEPTVSDPAHASMDALLAQLHQRTMTREPPRMERAV